MKQNPIIILGSSRSDGNTLKAVNTIIQDPSIPIVDLNQLNIAYYDYAYENKKDDFIPLAERMVGHDPLILATPVYWYCMSAIMKTFIDRWTDLVNVRKDLGRRLAGKELYLITSYGSPTQPRGFEEPFFQTCEYLKMEYKGCFYFYGGPDKERKAQNIPHAEAFLEKIKLA